MSFNRTFDFNIPIDFKSIISAQLFNRLWTNVFLKVFIVNAVFKLIGLVCNIFSFIIFYRSSFKSPSTVLILLLTVGETMYMLRESDMVIIHMMYTRDPFDNGSFGFQVASMIVQATEHVGTYASSTIVVFITVDRCIAVLYPLRYHSVVTTRRVWALSISAYALWALWSTLEHSLYFICEDQDPWWDMCSSPVLLEITSDAAMVVETTMSTAPVLIVIVGCVVIGVKIKLSQKRRIKLGANISQRKTNLRTTKMLLAISLAFAMVYGYSFLITLLGTKAQYLYNIITDIALLSSRYIFIDINSSCNFVIYVLSNAKFRKTFLDIFTPRCWVKKHIQAL